MNKLISIVFITLLSFVNSLNAKTFPTKYPATLVKVIDADTIKVCLEIYPKLYKIVNLRISGIDSPETRRGSKDGKPITETEIKLGKAATAYAGGLLNKSKKLVVGDLEPSKTKYAGRINGKLWFDDKSYGDHMVEKGWAVKYAGGKRVYWNETAP